MAQIADAESQAKNHAINNYQQEIKEAESRVRQAESHCKKAEDENKKFQGRMDKIKQILERVSSLKETVFDELQENGRGKSLSMEEVAKKVAQMMNFLTNRTFRDWGEYATTFEPYIQCEAALLTSFEQAARHTYGERGAVCHEAMTGVEGVGPKLSKLIDAIKREYASYEPELSRLQEDAVRAKDEMICAQQQLERLRTDRAGLLKDLEAAKSYLMQLKKKDA
jgi:predicted  nucleic acid-binding Zn-ribbon protein